MALYSVPLAEVRFVVHDVADLASVVALPGYEEVTPDLVDAVLEEAARFAEEVLAPLNTVGDREGVRLDNGQVKVPASFHDAYRQFTEGGWCTLPFEAKWGGQGLPLLVSTAVSEIWTAANMAFFLCPMLTQTAAEFLAAYGSEDLKSRYLRKLVSGEWTGTMNLTEPQAGSDLGRLRTRAVRESDHYLLTGQKIFITYGDHDLAENVIHTVLARTPDGPPGVKGLSLFLVPKVLVNPDGTLGARNDVRCASLEHKLGIHASPTAVMIYGDEGGAVGYLIGEENRGLELMFTMMNAARLSVGLEGVGIADRAYQGARNYAFERVQGRPLGMESDEAAPIAHHPDVQRMLMAMKSRSEASRALAYQVAAYLDVVRHHPDEAVRQQHLEMVSLLTPVVKGWCTETGIDIANSAIQVFGGMGFIEESGAPQHLRDSRVTAIYEGTTGIQANDLVGRKVARDEGRAARALFQTMRSLDDALKTSNDPHLSSIRHHLTRAIDQAEEAVDWIVDTYTNDPRRVSAGAVHFLNLMGTTVAGWLMARAALIAQARLAASAVPAAQWESKLLTARFFADTYLSTTAALKEQFVSGAEALATLDPQRHL